MNPLNRRTQAFLELIATDSLPALGPEIRAGVKSKRELLPAIDAFCSDQNITGLPRELLRSAGLLWHDDLDGSHEISQCIKTADGSFLHGIMHRREPDNSNAKYWFRLVGEHAVYPKLAAAVDSVDAGEGGWGPASDRFLADGRWDPFAFVDACTRSAPSRTSTANDPILQRIQGLEFQLLLDHFLSG